MQAKLSAGNNCLYFPQATSRKLLPPADNLREVNHPLSSDEITCRCRQFAWIVREVPAAWAQVNLNLPVFAGKLHVTQMNCVWSHLHAPVLQSIFLFLYKSSILNLFQKSETRYEKSHVNLLINLWRVCDCQFACVPGNGNYYTSSGLHPWVSTVKCNSQNILFRSDTISKEEQYSLLFPTLWASHNWSSVPSRWRINWHICYFKPRVIVLSIAAKKSFWILSLTASTTLPTSFVILLVKLPSNVRTSRAF